VKLFAIIVGAILTAFILIVVGFFVVQAYDHGWHNIIGADIAVRNVALANIAYAKDEDEKAKDHDMVIQADKDIIAFVKKKPSWSTFTDDELSAIDAAKSDLSQ